MEADGGEGVSTEGGLGFHIHIKSELIDENFDFISFRLG